MTAVVAMSALLASCTSSPDPSPEGQPGTPTATESASGSPSAAPVTLRFGVYGDTAAVASYRRLARVYRDEHPNVTLRVQPASDSEAAQADLDRELASGNAPDVFLTDHDAVPGLVDAGQVQPVDELLEERGVQFGDAYERVGLEAFSANLALQCMPHDVSPLVVYYNKDLLRLRKITVEGEAPVTPEDGWTWEQFTAAATKMSRNGVKGVYIEPSLDTLSALIRSGGGNTVDDDRTPTTLTLSDGTTRSALEEVLTLVRNSQLTPTREAVARQDAITRFVKGKIGMTIGTRALVPQLRTVDGLNFDVMPLPRLGRFSTVSVMTGYCISASSPNIDAAADFLAFAVSSRGARITARSGGIVPANLAAEHSPAFLQPDQQPKNVSVFIDGVRRSDSTPFLAAWPGVVSATRPDIERIFYDPIIDLDTLLPQMDEQSQRILEPPTASASPR